ncbi:amidohydrolase [Actinosynnema sp. ALI-1.44]|uniref:amidohydrolase family protein n=1 Tax=Actinosynnema sp. ALI-1.44 TaxID=1933779 RepID=UPI00097CB851|nr:amidohydrolase family protein [Actinosynnema sp. ALI-1.44]ONI79958.1 amidohydrolase [Actinosynnema sp. ALI-1.44]
MEHVDTLITHAHMFTMRGDGVGYVKDGAVAVKGQRIVAVDTTGELTHRFTAEETVDATGHALLPGLIDAHVHTALAVIRGVAQDVRGWLEKAYWPFYKQITDKDVVVRSMACVLEGLKAGTTTFVDFVDPAAECAEAYVASGVRGRLVAQFNALTADEQLTGLYALDQAAGHARLAEAAAFANTWNGSEEGRITVVLGPVAPDLVLREHLVETKRVADRHGLMINMHVAQGDRETAQMLQRYGQRTVAYLDELGYLDDQLMAVHLTVATEQEAEYMARNGVSMMLCSSAIGLVDGVVPPSIAFRRAGGLVALGSDNGACTMFNEMRLTAYFNKILKADPTVMPAWEVMRMATIDGARAIGLGDQIGSLEVGKQADLITVDLSGASLGPVLGEPVRNIIPNLVYSARGTEVRMVMVAGRVLMRDGEVLTMDERSVLDDARDAAQAIADRVAANPAHRDLVLVSATKDGRL